MRPRTSPRRTGSGVARSGPDLAAALGSGAARSSNMWRRSATRPSRTSAARTPLSACRSPPRMLRPRSSCFCDARRSGAPARKCRIRSAEIIALSGRRELAPFDQPAALQGVEVAIQDAVDVADLELGAGVFAHLIGLEHIAADLAAEINVELAVFDLAGGSALLLELVLVEARTQDLHRHVLVLVLRALVLALHHDIGRQMDDAHRRVGHIDVLPALAAGAEGVNAQVLFADVDLDFVVNFRADEDAGKRGMAALGLVEGRDANQAVDAALRLQQPVGVFALDGDGGGLDARFLALLPVVDRDPEAVALGPARVHAQQHFGPVLAFGAAGAGMDGEDGVEAIVFAAEQRAGFDRLQVRAQRGLLARDLLEHGLALARQLEVGAKILERARQALVVVQQLLHPLARAVHGLRARRIAPEIRRRGLLIEFGELLAQRGRVKDTPGRRAPGRLVAGVRAAVRPDPCPF